MPQTSQTVANTPKNKKFGLFRKDSKLNSNRHSTRLSKNIESAGKEDKKESGKKKKQVKWIELKEIITF